MSHYILNPKDLTCSGSDSKYIKVVLAEIPDALLLSDIVKVQGP